MSTETASLTDARSRDPASYRNGRHQREFLAGYREGANKGLAADRAFEFRRGVDWRSLGRFLGQLKGQANDLEIYTEYARLERQLLVSMTFEEEIGCAARPSSQ